MTTDKSYSPVYKGKPEVKDVTMKEGGTSTAILKRIWELEEKVKAINDDRKAIWNELLALKRPEGKSVKSTKA